MSSWLPPRCFRKPVRPLRLFRTISTTSSRRQSDHVRIVEVGPRDGLQNEKQTIPLNTKIELCERLVGTGLKTVEAGSFVAPKWVPQMDNSNNILEHVLQTPPSASHDVSYQWLLPNQKGLDRFLATCEAFSQSFGAMASYPTPPPSPSPTNDQGPSLNTSTQDPNAMPSSTRGLPSTSPNSSTFSFPPNTSHEISLFCAATESFSHRNTNCSIAESLSRFRPLITTAKSHGLKARAYISVALGCPFEGPDAPSPTTVADIATSLLEMGADEISVADTTGMGTAPRTEALLKALSAAGVRTEDLALHFHDTYGMALVNALVSLNHGVRVFDAAVGGLGGCPFSPGATGNVATEEMVYFMESLGLRTGVDLGEVARIGEWISGELGRDYRVGSRVGKAKLSREKWLEEKGKG
ncbi:aldolase [Viridothelium virens]|uniref:hydroxymethylglutaryl-CoA lyase n=1 Tax=Viridothelium virens TaxID=1048519 RepID=A0A6A6HFF3_VIRVR|nr:aldolase [Viridothelium virens]